MNETQTIPVCSSRRKIDVYFRANGRIDISSHVAWALGLTEGDVLSVLQRGSEYYLYVSRRASDIMCQMARYPHAVRQRHKGCNTYYCNAASITKVINSVSDSAESWLYVGNSKDIPVDGRTITALPLIVRNNQYNK